MKYRKKPITIEAFRFRVHKEPGWFLDAVAKSLEGGIGSVVLTADSAMINTLEGTMSAFDGDWIIRGVKGELYPCKPDIFEATYDPV